MNTEREQPLNPPGIDAPERKIKRQYVPMREYDDIEANGYAFHCFAEVEACGTRDQSTRTSKIEWLGVWAGEAILVIPEKFLASAYFPNDPRIPGDTWMTLIEREICRQARELPGTAWEVEYEGDE